MLLASVDFNDPLLWAVFIGWILSVVLHEFGHGIVAYLGGDYTIRERGGLTLNPIQYIDPVFSIVFPAIVFLLGGVPLPGGVTYIRRDLIRNGFWQIATSLAGPAMNLLIGLAMALPFHPRFGWIDASTIGNNGETSNAYLFLGAMVWLQLLSVLFNLIPLPPLDGFQVLAYFLPANLRHHLQQPAIRRAGFVLIFVVLSSPAVFVHFHEGVAHVLQSLGFDVGTINFFGSCYNRALFH